ncbi:hypothetical protein EVAR_39455_1 [Eumeta japonica]|uniref:Uncharacterized protein n=1 Tax=Eumeta variegata TaxID=151549 RepID=A0A4C1W2V4_EUMVA|nr:hypothetical protein EVAR_39455_1 [Eumeta japonica]
MINAIANANPDGGGGGTGGIVGFFCLSACLIYSVPRPALGGVAKLIHHMTSRLSHVVSHVTSRVNGRDVVRRSPASITAFHYTPS